MHCGMSFIYDFIVFWWYGTLENNKMKPFIGISLSTRLISLQNRAVNSIVLLLPFVMRFYWLGLCSFWNLEIHMPWPFFGIWRVADCPITKKMYSDLHLSTRLHTNKSTSFFFSTSTKSIIPHWDSLYSIHSNLCTQQFFFFLRKYTQ